MLSGNFADTKSVLSRINCNRLFFFTQVNDVCFCAVFVRVSLLSPSERENAIVS